MARRASPSVGHGDNLPPPEAYLRALALELQMVAKKKALNEQHKRIRTAIESSGVVVDDLKTMFAMREKSVSEIEQWFRRKYGALSAQFGGLKAKFGEDLFSGYAEPDGQQHTWIHRGRMVGVSGGDPIPPKGITTEESNWWMSGYHEGSDAFTAAKPVLADILAEALETADEGGVVDGTTTSDVGKKTAAKRARKGRARLVADQAAADFAADEAPAPTAD